MPANAGAAKIDEILATLLATHMGWKPSEDAFCNPAWNSQSGQHLHTKTEWQPSLNMEQAFIVIRYLNAKNFLISVIQMVPGVFIVNVVSVKGAKNGSSCFKGHSLPRTICKAALSVLRSIKV